MSELNRCAGCGGILGVDCWNERECVVITEDIRLREAASPAEQSDKPREDLVPLTPAMARALADMWHEAVARAEAAEARIKELAVERDRLIAAIGEHVTVCSDYLARAEAVEANRDEWKDRAHGYERRLGSLGKELVTAEADLDRLKKALEGSQKAIGDLIMTYGDGDNEGEHGGDHDDADCPTCQVIRCAQDAYRIARAALQATIREGKSDE